MNGISLNKIREQFRKFVWLNSVILDETSNILDVAYIENIRLKFLQNFLHAKPVTDVGALNFQSNSTLIESIKWIWLHWKFIESRLKLDTFISSHHTILIKFSLRHYSRRTCDK